MNRRNCKMLNNAFFNIVFYNNKAIDYSPPALVSSLDIKNIKYYQTAGIDAYSMLKELRVLETLHFACGKFIPDIDWEFEYVQQRTENYYSALLNSVEKAIKLGLITRINIFYPFIRSAYVEDASKHGSTIYTFLTEFICFDGTSVFCVSEEIPDTIKDLNSIQSAVDYTKRVLNNVRHSSFFYSKYKYFLTKNDEIFAKDKNNLFFVNYVLSNFIKINFNVDTEKNSFRIIITSYKINSIESCNYNTNFKMNLCKENSVILLNSPHKHGYDKFAYSSYKRTFECVFLLCAVETFINMNRIRNCLSYGSKSILDNVKKYASITSQKMDIPLSAEFSSLVKNERKEILLETLKDILGKAFAEYCDKKTSAN